MFIFIEKLDLQATKFSTSNFPIIVINNNGQTIPLDERIVANLGVIYNGPGMRNTLTDEFNNYSGQISIEIRGQSSSHWAKKSFNIETQNEDGSNRNVPLLGLPKENDWVLYATYYDRSLIRNVLCYHWFREMGWYASRTKFCELVLNGNYQGIYILLEKIKADKNRVDIEKLTANDIDSDNVTGGYIIKIDKDGTTNPGFNTTERAYPSPWQSIRFQYHYPEGDKITPEQENYIKNYIYEFEAVMNSKNYQDEQTGYPKYLNVESFIDNFFINELSRNVDSYRLSTFFYKDRDSKGGKLTAGPVWDYDFSFGDVSYFTADQLEGWFITYLTEDPMMKMDFSPAPFWWKKLLADPRFTTKLKSRWQELRLTTLNLDNIYQYIDLVADSLIEARERNFEIWIGPGDPPTSQDQWFPEANYLENIKTYEDEINYLKNWIAMRIDWIDKNIYLTSVRDESILTSAPTTNIVMQNFPNPFNAVTCIAFDLHLSEKIDLKLYHLNGALAYSIAEGFFQHGHHQVKINAKDLPSGVYVYQLKTESGSLINKKLIILK
jgi:hypothetical protein